MVRQGGQELSDVRTRYVDNGGDKASWTDLPICFSVPVEALHAEYAMDFEVWDYNDHVADKLIGHASVNISHLAETSRALIDFSQHFETLSAELINEHLAAPGNISADLIIHKVTPASAAELMDAKNKLISTLQKENEELKLSLQSHEKSNPLRAIQTFSIGSDETMNSNSQEKIISSGRAHFCICFGYVCM